MTQFHRVHSEETLGRLYEATVFAKALNEVYPEGPGHSEPVQADSVITDEQWFHSLVNKFAQVCDSERGGNTVTAAAVLQDADGPVIVLGSNQRNQTELKRMKDFMQRLLSLIGNNSERLQKKALTKRVLRTIFEFTIKRVDFYLKKLSSYVDKCIAYCANKEVDLGEDLQKFRILANFPRDIVSSTNSKDKFFSDCETLVKAILANKDTKFDRNLQRLAMDKDSSISEPWRELRHYCGRLLSYRQAAETFIAARERWPELFCDVKVAAISSSTRMPRPLQRGLTGADVIRNMGLEEGASEEYLRQTQDLQKFDLDAHIQDLVAKPSFRPIVHAEVLIHSRLQVLSKTPDQLYWNGWIYIGSSKPTCRLCSYYFEDQDVAVRPTHNNIYPNWRLPDLPQLADEEAITKQREVVEEITQDVRDDVIEMFNEKRFMGQKHDTLTYSDLMYGGGNSSSVAPSDNGLSSFAVRGRAPSQPASLRRTVARALDEDNDITNEREYDSDNDETDSSGAESLTKQLAEYLEGYVAVKPMSVPIGQTI